MQRIWEMIAVYDKRYRRTSFYSGDRYKKTLMILPSMKHPPVT